MYPVLYPKIDMERKPMKNLTEETQRYICNCDEPCEYYIHLDEYGRFCEKDALDIAYSLFFIIKELTRVGKREGLNRAWTVKEEQLIIDWYAKGFRYGDRKIISDILGRSYRSVVSKINRMREDGIIENTRD